MHDGYKRFQAARTVFYTIALIAITTLLCAAPAQADTAFTVRDVTVDVTADSAAAARDQAFAQAQVEAFATLAARLLSEDRMADFQTPDAAVISGFIKDFEITNEQLSAVRYVGTYTFRFESGAVRDYMNTLGVAYADVSSKPVLILPFYQHGAQALLWTGPNPWRAAWNNSRAGQGLVPVNVPLGDARDIAAIGDDEVLTYQPDKLQDMTLRYGAGEAIIMLATPEGDIGGGAPAQLTITIYRTDRGAPEYANRLTVNAADPKPGEDLYAAAVRKSRAMLQQSWKQRTLAGAGQENSLTVRVPFTSMQEWVETQQVLRRVQGISTTQLISLTQNGARLTLTFRGSENRLRLALAQADMTLSAPRVDFNASGHTPGAYGRYAQAGSPLVYELYLNKYRAPY